MSTLHVAKIGNTPASTGHDRAGRCSYAMGGVHLSPGHALFAVAEIGKRSAGLPLRCKKKNRLAWLPGVVILPPGPFVPPALKD